MRLKNKTSKIIFLLGSKFNGKQEKLKLNSIFEAFKKYGGKH